MIAKFIKNPNLGLLGEPFAPAKKEWIPLVLAAAGLATSIAGGAASSAKANTSERRQRALEAQEKAWYNRRYNEEYIDTAAGQNLVRRAKDYAKEQWRKAAGAQAVSGGTAAATQMAKDAGNKMVGDAFANIAATDQMRKANIDTQHRQAEQNFAQMDMQRDLQRAQNIANATQGASNAMMSAAGAIEQGSSVKAPSLQGGSNNGVTFSPPSEQEQVSSGFMGDNAVTRAFGQGTEAERQAMRRAIMQGG